MYKLLTPGPLTTTESVKKEMLFDHCTWDEDYKKITQTIRQELLDMAGLSKEKYTTVLMQGSGTFGVEALFGSLIGENDKLLILANGAYGERMGDIARYNKINHRIYRESYDKVPSAERVKEILEEDSAITHVAMVHSETTSGILNDIESVGRVVKAMNKVFMVDAMSSFGGVPIDIDGIGIDFIVSSANKCIQGVPGFAFVICNRELLEKSKGTARSLSLDLYDQWKTMEKDGKWRFTSPTHTVLAFAKAIEEMKAEGGIEARSKRYYDNNSLLIKLMTSLGFETYIKNYRGPVITTFLYPENANYTFGEMYEYIKERGYAIYPGKVTEAVTFRIGNIGEIYKEDIEKLYNIIKAFLQEREA